MQEGWEGSEGAQEGKGRLSSLLGCAAAAGPLWQQVAGRLQCCASLSLSSILSLSPPLPLPFKHDTITSPSALPHCTIWGQLSPPLSSHLTPPIPSLSLTGSDDMNVRIWKAQASEQLGMLLPRERHKHAYNKALIERHKHLPEVKKIVRQRHVPVAVHKVGAGVRLCWFGWAGIARWSCFSLFKCVGELRAEGAGGPVQKSARRPGLTSGASHMAT